MKKLLLSLFAMLMTLGAVAQNVSAVWNTDGESKTPSATVDGDPASVSSVNCGFLLGTNIDSVAVLNAADGTRPMMLGYYGKTRVTSRTAQYCVAYSVTPTDGHKFKPLKISFDACKVGTDGGNFDVIVKESGGSEIVLANGESPLRNKIVEGTNPTGYSKHEYVVNDMLVEGKSFIVIIYMYNFNGTDSYNDQGQFTGKCLAVRNVKIEGSVDEEIFTAEHFVNAATCMTADGETTIDLMPLVKDLRYGGLARYKTKLYGDPKDFNLDLKEGYTYSVNYSGKVAIFHIKNANDEEVFYFEVSFVVSNRQPKPEARPLGRGFVAVNTGANGTAGNLLSWRYHKSDDAKVKFKLYRGTSETRQRTALNDDKFITSSSNFHDVNGTINSYYKLEVYDLQDSIIETVAGVKAWPNQVFNIPTQTPKDERGLGATYTPNDASFCDMDGDGEYEIILKWDPSNSKDAAGDGVTSSTYFDCYKLDGTMLWRINQGRNLRSGAHTTPFIAWDLDGDGYGEFMIKTAPGTIDGEGNYVILGDDDPEANWLSGRGKPQSGPEYITVFDGMTGAEIHTLPYHTDYATGENYWGDSKANRSERYTACLAWLDGEDANPTAIFNRGYYAGAFVGAYDFDGDQLKLRWLSRNIQSGKGLWGEGAHWLTAADLDGDGFQEIQFGSAALDHDGSLLYRTGLGHGDAFHIGDFLPNREGLEMFMVHEEKPFGMDLRDAATGEFILRWYKDHCPDGLSITDDTGRGLAAHFDSSLGSSQFIFSASPSMYNCDKGTVNGEKWAIGSSGAGINCRVYWSGDLYDEFFDKSIIAHWNPDTKNFDRYKFNGGNYLAGKLNNASKYNPCVLGDLLGDWREEIVTWNEGDNSLNICATDYPTTYLIPHLMDDAQYRANVISQNVGYNQPPHLSVDPSVVYKNNPIAKQISANIKAAEEEKKRHEEEMSVDAVESDIDLGADDVEIRTISGTPVQSVTVSGIYVINGKKVYVK